MLVTIPAPGATASSTSSLPKKINSGLSIVGASFSLPMVNTAPLLLSYVILVAGSSLKKSDLPLV